MQFTFGLTLWCTVLFAVWLLVWPNKLPFYAYIAIPFGGLIVTSRFAEALFYYAPMNEWSFRQEPEPHKFSANALFALVFSALPICSLMMGLMFAFFDRMSFDPARRGIESGNRGDS